MAGPEKRLFDELPRGLTHPATDLAELRAIAGNWRQRVADFETFRNAELRSYLRRSGIEIIVGLTANGRDESPTMPIVGITAARSAQ